VSDDRRRVDEGAVVPVFPLPDLVFFPETVIPLHVFETRYREMVKEASAGENLIGMALLRPGFEKDYDGSPEIHPVGTVGQIEQLRPLPDGRFLLNLRGLARVAYREVPSGRSYRTACVGLRRETAADPADPDLESAKMDLLTTHALLARALSGTAAPTLMMNDRIPFAAAVNRACLDLPVAAELRQELLVLDDLRERRRRVSRLLDEILHHVLSEKNEAPRNELPS
jgi:Lon protease-like protein